MSNPLLQIDLDKIFHNASTLVARLKCKGVSVTGVTKAFLGASQIAKTLLRAGVSSLGDSRIENIEFMRKSGITAQMILIRTPMLSQTDRVVASADLSFNTELDVLFALSSAAVKARKTHGIVLMVELGDLREGIMPRDVEKAVRTVLELPNIKLMGLGTNLACRNGVSPDNRNMAELSAIENRFVPTDTSTQPIVSGGNSSNLNWVFGGGEIGCINNLRLGEAILLGREALNRQPINGLFTDAICLMTEVIESSIKPSKPWGTIAQSAFNGASNLDDQGYINQAIAAVGRQDTDPEGLHPPNGIEVLGASSDHLILNARAKKLVVGSTVSFQLNYGALLHAMTSPHVAKTFVGSEVIGCPRPELQTLPSAAQIFQSQT